MYIINREEYAYFESSLLLIKTEVNVCAFADFIFINGTFVEK
jgi:hypothetical protein